MKLQLLKIIGFLLFKMYFLFDKYAQSNLILYGLIQTYTTYITYFPCTDKRKSLFWVAVHFHLRNEIIYVHKVSTKKAITV